MRGEIDSFVEENRTASIASLRLAGLFRCIQRIKTTTHGEKNDTDSITPVIDFSDPSRFNERTDDILRWGPSICFLRLSINASVRAENILLTLPYNGLNATMVIVSLAVLALLCTTIQGKASFAAKQTRADVCPNPEGNRMLFYIRGEGPWDFLLDNACLFGFCDNGGTCVEDPTILECYRCTCPPGYTGRLCDSVVAIVRTRRR